MHLFPFVWDYGHRFPIEYVDHGFVPQDFGVEIKFDQYSRASYHVQNMIGGMLGYVGKI